MSTYWYFECLDHTPALRSEGEFTQHTGDYKFRAALALAKARPVDPFQGSDAHCTECYFEHNARDFLVSHPTCHIEAVSEYGERCDLDGDRRYEEPTND